MSDQSITIDNIIGVHVPDGKYLNECSALYFLMKGLSNLYGLVSSVEKQIIKNNPGWQIAFWGRNEEYLPNYIHDALPCHFHWFGTSVCNYARLSGFVVAREKGLITEDDLGYEPERKKIKKVCDEYVGGIPELAQVLKWRNKVGAHFALTDPRADDNIATLEASIFYPIGFEGARFITSPMVLTKGNNDVMHESEIPVWSLTGVFESLTQRFWPHMRIENV